MCALQLAAQTQVDLTRQGKNLILPLPSASRLGGVFSHDCGTGNGVRAINPDGSLSCAQAGSGGGGTSGWSGLTAPAANLSLAMAGYSTTFTWSAATGSINGLTYTDTANNTGTGILMHISTAAGSAMVPWQADANGVGYQVGTDGGFHAVNQVNAGALTLSRAQSGGTGMATLSLQGAAAGTWSITPPANFTSWTFTPPAVPAGAHQWLTTDGSGNGSFTQPASSDLSDTANLDYITGSTLKKTFTVGAGGVTAHAPVKYAGGQVVATTGTEGALGIAENTVAAGGSVVVDLIGPSSCIAAGAITANDYVSVSAGNCADTGQTTRSNIATNINLLGKADNNYTSGQTVGVDLVHPYATGAQAAGVTAGSMISVNNAAVSFNPFDRTTRVLVNESFCGGNTSSGSIGREGWTLVNLGAGTAAVAASLSTDQDHPCGVKLSNASGVNDGAMLSLSTGFQMDTSGTVFSGATARSGQFEVQAHLGATTDIRVYLGLIRGTAMIPGASTYGCYFRYDTVLSDAGWMAVCNGASSPTVTSTGVVADSGKHRFDIQWTATSTPNVTFYIDGSLVATITANTPPAGSSVGPVLMVANDSNVTIDCLDLYSAVVWVTGLNVN